MQDRTNPPPLRVAQPLADSGHRATASPTAATSLAPWVARDLDPDQAVTELGHRFPNAVIWWGDFTGSYWVLARTPNGTPKLIEAATPDDLYRRLNSLRPCASQPAPYRALHRPSPTYNAPTAPPRKKSSIRRSPFWSRRCRGRHTMAATPNRSGTC